MTTVGSGRQAGFVLLHQPLRTKVISISLAACMPLPALVQVVLMASLGARPLSYTAYPYLMQVILAAIVIVEAPVIMTTRMGSSARFWMLTVTLALLTAAPLTIMFAGEVVTGSPNADDFAKGLLGAGLYAAVIAATGLAASAATAHRRTMSVVATFLLTMTSSQVLYGVLQSMGHGPAAAWGLLVSPFNMVDSVLQWSLGAAPTEGIVYPAGAGPVALAGVTLLIAVSLHDRWISRASPSAHDTQQSSQPRPGQGGQAAIQDEPGMRFRL